MRSYLLRIRRMQKACSDEDRLEVRRQARAVGRLAAIPDVPVRANEIEALRRGAKAPMERAAEVDDDSRPARFEARGVPGGRARQDDQLADARRVPLPHAIEDSLEAEVPFL